MNLKTIDKIVNSALFMIILAFIVSFAFLYHSYTKPIPAVARSAHPVGVIIRIQASFDGINWFPCPDVGLIQKGNLKEGYFTITSINITNQ
jgi:hypothetical protein